MLRQIEKLNTSNIDRDAYNIYCKNQGYKCITKIAEKLNEVIKILNNK